jgi:hypothetical protein
MVHGPRVTTFTRFVSDAGIPGRAERCGEILLRVNWDLKELSADGGCLRSLSC